jgi:regulation of enolase protein 1 (concanavalin A-like superfamily)
MRKKMTRSRRMIVVLLAAVALSSATGRAQFSSDDFNSYNLKRSIWTYSDPLRDGTVSLAATGTQNASLSITVPEGTDHQPWTGGYLAPRVMQSCLNQDLQVEVKFLSAVAQPYQIQGILVEQDSTHFLRFDFSSDGTATYVFAAAFSGSYATPTVEIGPDSIAPAGVSPLYIKVTRLGTLWAVAYSLNGTTYFSPSTPNFNHTLSVRKIGAFAANSATEFNPAPAHTALVDYFFNSASPINPEDGGSTTDVLPPLVYNVASIPGVAGFRADWKTDEAAQGTVQYGTTLSYGKSVSHSDLRSVHSLQITGLTSSTPYNFRIISTDNRGNRDTTANFTAVTQAASPPTISIWYGNPQSFGRLGVPQRTVNILGSVYDSAGVDSLYYRLNGGARVNLATGPDTRRLQNPGDFNIDVPYSVLQNGANTIVVTARNLYGASASSTITVNDNSSKVWPQPYAVSFTNPSSLLDSAQVIDGKWGIGPGGVRTIGMGYDRGLAIGDTTWDDYSVLAQFTVHGIDSTLETIRGMYGGPGVGFQFRWKGHTNNPIFDPPIMQPLSGYLPLGAVGWYRWRDGFESGLSNQWELIGNGLALKAHDTTYQLSYGKLYNLKMEVRTLPGVGGQYRLKVWEEGQVEPSLWRLEGQETLADPQTGSVVFLANFVDVTVRKFVVTPKTGIPPTISGVSVTTSSRSAIVRWNTIPDTRCTLSYGLTASYGDSIRESSRAWVHEALLTGLKAGSVYHYRIVAVDSAGLLSSSGDLVFSTLATPPQTTLVSDEFNSGSLNASLWTVINPVPPGGSSVGTTGVEAYLSLNSGVAHDLWTSGATVPRLMQACNNTDFDLLVKFNTSVTGDLNSYQVEGLLIEQDQNNLVRIDFNSGAGDSVALFAASFTGGFSAPSILLNRNIAPHGTSPLYLRLLREGTVWVVDYSFDAATWRPGGVFVLPLNVSGAGIFAANPGGSPPAFSALADFFRAGSGVASATEQEGLPTEFTLAQNYPNPFNPSTRIHFAIPAQGNVVLEIFSTLGQKVATLVDDTRSAGYYSVAFDGRALSSGLYLYRLSLDGRSLKKKMLLVK